MGGGQQSQPLGTVRLEYTAGKNPQKFIETFQVLEGLAHDVIIGKPLMTAAHMMMVNPNFANPPNHPALCLMELRPKDKGKVFGNATAPMLILMIQVQRQKPKRSRNKGPRNKRRPMKRSLKHKQRPNQERNIFSSKHPPPSLMATRAKAHDSTLSIYP